MSWRALSLAAYNVEVSSRFIMNPVVGHLQGDPNSKATLLLTYLKGTNLSE